jgi:hypothetical protein
MIIAIDYETYLAAMAAMLEADAMAVRLGFTSESERWTTARKNLKAAMLKAVAREIDESVPALLRKQAG